MSEALKPIELIVKKLSSRTCCLSTADLVIEFCLDQLHQQESNISTASERLMIHRIISRRGIFENCIKFLSHAKESLRKVEKKAAKNKVKVIALKFHINEDVTADECGNTNLQEDQGELASKLEKFIKNANAPAEAMDSVDSELALYMSTDKLGNILENVSASFYPHIQQV